MMRGALVVVALTATLSAQQGVPQERPARLLAVHELALAAYPELREQGLQLRVDGAEGSRITFGFAARDREDLLGLSRPREAQLVVEAAFNGEDALTNASLRGRLTKAVERRRIRALAAGGWVAALRAEGAAYGPDKRAELLRDLNLPALAKTFGELTRGAVRFEPGTEDEGLFWEVRATSASGTPVTLAFEPFNGRLVRVVSGGAQ